MAFTCASSARANIFVVGQDMHAYQAHLYNNYDRHSIMSTQLLWVTSRTEMACTSPRHNIGLFSISAFLGPPKKEGWLVSVHPVLLLVLSILHVGRPTFFWWDDWNRNKTCKLACEPHLYNSSDSHRMTLLVAEGWMECMQVLVLLADFEFKSACWHVIYLFSIEVESKIRLSIPLKTSTNRHPLHQASSCLWSRTKAFGWAGQRNTNNMTCPWSQTKAFGWAGQRNRNNMMSTQSWKKIILS